MTRAKASVAARLPIRRGLSEAEAAVYIGIGATKFREMVEAGQMPRPRKIGDRRVWDVIEIDAAFAALPVDGPASRIGGPRENPWH